MKEISDKEKRIASVGKEILTWENREGFLKNAIENAMQSSLLLRQMEADDLLDKLSGQGNQFRTKLAKEEEKLSQIPAFPDSLAITEILAVTRRNLAEEKAKVAELKKHADERKRGTIARRKTENWSDIVKECVNLAECWLENRDKLIQADSATGRKADPTYLEL